MKRAFTCLGAGLLVLVAGAAESPSSLVFVNPKASSFWHMATNNVVSIPIAFPSGATTATLAVTGDCYAAVHAGITGEAYELTLPAATSPGAENTYALTLSFDTGDVRTARVSVISGQDDAAGAGTTRCLSSGLRAWPRTADARLTLPIPAGASSLKVNGAEVETGLDGEQGFCTVSGVPASLSLTVGEAVYEVDVTKMPGFLLFLH